MQVIKVVCISSINWVFSNLESRILHNVLSCLLFIQKVNLCWLIKKKIPVKTGFEEKKSKQILRNI